MNSLMAYLGISINIAMTTVFTSTSTATTTTTTKTTSTSADAATATAATGVGHIMPSGCSGLESHSHTWLTRSANAGFLLRNLF